MPEEFLPSPQFEMPKVKLPKPKPERKRGLPDIIILVVFVSIIAGFLAGIIAGKSIYSDLRKDLEELKTKLPETRIVEKETVKEYIPQTSQEEAIIQVVKKVSPAVVSIIITKEFPVIVFEFPFDIPQSPQKFEKQEVGGGTGFLISEDGMIVTNKHVVLDKDAEYTVLTNDGRRFEAEVLARDPILDLAILDIEGDNFSTVQLGDSESLQIGQTIIAIGNALAEFKNTVSVGVVSGLGRTITASGGGMVQVLEDVIQTDAAINKGNSGGPLLNLRGEVIGINTAMAFGAENIGFAIPVNKAKRAIEQVKTTGKIVYPFLGVCWTLVTEQIQEELNLSVDYGALIKSGEGCETAIVTGSAAQKAGLKEGDVILEMNGERVDSENSLGKIILRYNPGDKITLKVLRSNKEKTLEATLGERKEE